MESILSLFVYHDTYVVSGLVIGITVIVVMLLLFNQKSPESVVRSEMAGSDDIEGTLRRVLREGSWTGSTAGSEKNAGHPARVNELEKEILDKDRTIATLNKQLTQSGGGGGEGAVAGDDSDLLSKIQDLEARLMEYEIIEDDIADLSLYKTENEKLKAELARLKSQLGGESEEEEFVAHSLGAPAVETDDGAESEANTAVVDGEEADEGETIVDQQPDEEEPDQEAADLVAEFEKVVNNQAQLDSDDGETVSATDADDSGDVRVSSEASDEGSETLKVVGGNGDDADSSGVAEVSQQTLEGVEPDSKEEAEVFIRELKSLKKG